MIREVDLEMVRAMERMRVVNDFIAPLRASARRSGHQGVHECPICKGRLHVIISRFNGHARVTCETTDCVSWIE